MRACVCGCGARVTVAPATYTPKIMPESCDAYDFILGNLSQQHAIKPLTEHDAQQTALAAAAAVVKRCGVYREISAE